MLDFLPPINAWAIVFLILGIAYAVNLHKAKEAVKEQTAKADYLARKWERLEIVMEGIYFASLENLDALERESPAEPWPFMTLAAELSLQCAYYDALGDKGRMASTDAYHIRCKWLFDVMEAGHTWATPEERRAAEADYKEVLLTCVGEDA